MLSREENELLTRTGPGTPMGELFRRFWAPVMLESELGGPDSAPVRVKVLGEQLVAFRDSTGRTGLLDAYCAHRRANLFWGRNEHHGLRCAYHGWKFDVDGQCVDLPNCPEGATLAARVQTRAFPTHLSGGLVWAYLGPGAAPAFPTYACFPSAPDRRFIRKIIGKGNYLQLMEGDIDSSHLNFLHNNEPVAVTRVDPSTFVDTTPRWFPEEKPYGLMLAAQRDAGPASYHWRVNQYLLPFVTLIAAHVGQPILNQVRIPVDDETTMHFRCFVHPDRPLTTEEVATYEEGVYVPHIEEDFHPVENLDNDYLIDRERQQTSSFTGIRSIVAQDLAVTQDQGGGWIADRSREYLVSSDRAIILLRRRLLAAAVALLAGAAPAELEQAATYGVRPGDFVLPRDLTVAEGVREHGLVGAA